MALARIAPEALQRAVDLAVQHQLRRGRQVVEEGGRRVEEQGQVVLDATAGDAVADVLVQARACRVAVELFAPARAEGGARGLVERELAAGQQPHLRHRVQAALRVGVEGADGVDLVVEQVDPVGHGRAHGEQVDEPAAHRVFAGRHHLADMLVAGQRQLRLQPGFVEPGLLPEVEGVGGQECGRGHAHQRRGGGQQHEVDLAVAQPPERGQALRDQVLVWREAVVGQGFPVGEQRDAQGRVEERHLVGQAVGIGGLRCDHHRELALPRRLARQPGEQQCIGRGDRPRQCKALAGGDGGNGQRHGRGRKGPRF